MSRSASTSSRSIVGTEKKERFPVTQFVRVIEREAGEHGVALESNARAWRDSREKAPLLLMLSCKPRLKDGQVKCCVKRRKVDAELDAIADDWTREQRVDEVLKRMTDDGVIEHYVENGVPMVRLTDKGRASVEAADVR